MKPFDANGHFRSIEVGSGLRRHAVRGAGVTVLAQGLVFGSQLIATVVLARVLMPYDFGLVAMVTTFSLVLMGFGQNGYAEAVMQREEMTHTLASNLFWITCGGGIVLALLFAALGPVLARFYGEPRVTTLAAVIAIGIFLSNIPVVHVALLKRALRFSVTSALDVISTVLSAAISIVMGLKGWGYWALVAALLGRPAIQMIGAWSVCRWVPSLPQRIDGTGSVVRFALHVYGRFSFNYSTRNTDNLLVGWRFGSSSLGFYKKAYDLFLLPANQLIIPVSDVVLSTLSRLERGSAEYRRYFLNGLSILAFVGLGGGAVLTLVGRDLIRVLLGAKWGEAGYIFTFFGPGIGIMLIYATSGLMHLSLGRADRWLRWVILEFAVTVMLFLVGLHWGPIGVASAWSASFWILFIPAFLYAGKPIEFGVTTILGAVWRYMLASLIAGAASAVVVYRWSGLVGASGVVGAVERIAITCVLFVTLYLGAIVLLHGGLQPLYSFIKLIPDMLPRKRSREALSASEVAPGSVGALTESEIGSEALQQDAKNCDEVVKH